MSTRAFSLEHQTVLLPLLFVVSVCCLFGSAEAAITLNQVDDFQNGSTTGWSEGGPSPNPPSIVTSGGPSGTGDKYLFNISSGGSGAGSRQVIFSTGSEWIGNYLLAQVSQITADIKDFSSSAPLSLRIAVQGGPSGTWFGSTTPVAVTTDGLWHHLSFGLSSAALSLVSGTDSLPAVLGNVSQLRILSSASAPSNIGDAVSSSLGVDNIRAVPEPSTWMMLAAAGFILLWCRYKRFGLK